MFKLERERTVTWPVNIPVPKDGGTVERHRVNLTFRVLDADGQAELLQAARDDGETMAQVIVGWDETVCDQEGEPLPFSEENLRRLLKLVNARAAIVETYFTEVVRGGARKN